MKNTLLIILVCSITLANAQSKKSGNFYLMPEIALLNGDQAKGSQIQVIGGLSKKNWRFGLGVGIDHYKFRSAPVFIHARNHFGKNKKGFAFASIGSNIPWVLEDQHKIWFTQQGGQQRSVFNMGWYSDIGVGYDIQLGKSKNLSLSMGYSVKKTSEEYEDWDFWIWPQPMPGPSTVRERTADYTFRRLSLKVGFQLW